MQTITAIFEHGVLKPTQSLDVPEGAEVRLTIEILPSPKMTVGKFNEFLEGLPVLDDAAEFAIDVRNIRTGLELLAYWQAQGLIEPRPDVVDSPDHARALREQAQRRARP